jgi:hypothetical protein
VLPVVFAIGCWPYPQLVLADPRILGSHAAIYTDAARTWLAGGNPWYVGPELAIFAGPPPMLLPFVPFINLPLDLTRSVWVVGSLTMAVCALRRLELPPYFLAFPPVFSVIVIGHPEMLVLWLIVLGGPLSGLAVLVKPYAGVALLAERRWRAILLAAAALLVTAPFLPWAQFVQELPHIGTSLLVQNTGDPVLETPLLVPLAIVALAWIGVRRGLWLAVPLLWPYAQPTYKVMTVPALSPVIALFWAIPLPGVTLVGVVAEAGLSWIAVRYALPSWLRSGLGPVARWHPPADAGFAA